MKIITLYDIGQNYREFFIKDVLIFLVGPSYELGWRNTQVLDPPWKPLQRLIVQLHKGLIVELDPPIKVVEEMTPGYIIKEPMTRMMFNMYEAGYALPRGIDGSEIEGLRPWVNLYAGGSPSVESVLEMSAKIWGDVWNWIEISEWEQDWLDYESLMYPVIPDET